MANLLHHLQGVTAQVTHEQFPRTQDGEQFIVDVEHNPVYDMSNLPNAYRAIVTASHPASNTRSEQVVDSNRDYAVGKAVESCLKKVLATRAKAEEERKQREEAERKNQEVEARARQVIKVLILSASPEDVDEVRLHEAMRVIQMSLVQLGTPAGKIQVIADYAAKPGILIDRLRDHKPHIVHFLAHMGQPGIMLLNDATNKPFVVPALGVKALFDHEITEGSVRCVLLTGCSSVDISNALKETVPYTIGTTQGIGNGFAAQFASRFYNSLARGDNLGRAFANAKAQVALFGFDPASITSAGAPDTTAV